MLFAGPWKTVAYRKSLKGKSILGNLVLKNLNRESIHQKAI